jgi:ribosomal protein S18 acetylase RimI-like enzyme
MVEHLARSYGVRQQAAELADATITTLLVEVEGSPAGYAQLRTSQPPDCVRGAAPLELWRFYVDRMWQGRGIARALMERVETDARQRGARTLWLGVWERNERAMAFYRKCGFADVGSQFYLVGSDRQTDRVMARAITNDRPTIQTAVPPPHESSHDN